MKSAVLWSCLALVAFPLAAQEVITPTNHIELFNGRDFTGWTFCLKTNAETAPAWTVTNSVIHCSGKPTGYLRTKDAYQNYKLTVEWRFVRVAPKADNTGVLLHMQLPDKVWPPCLQAQGKYEHQGDWLLMAGAECKEHKGIAEPDPVPKHGPANEKPVGEWNLYEMACSGNGARVWVNGRLMNEATECTLSSGFIGFQSEGGEFEIRKVFLDPLK